MPSPFPGMNPFFEQPTYWRDFHNEFLLTLRRCLVPQLDPSFSVHLEVHPTIHDVHQGRDGERVRFLEVRDRQGQDLVTVIELLSPSNKKPGDDNDQYLAKRRALLHSPAHLVEIDLLRGGLAMPPVERPPCDYSAMVSRAERRPAVGFWPIRLRDRLPIVPIPLRPDVEDARVDLQEVLHQAYDGVGYERLIYKGTPQPPLSSEEAEWARSLVPAAISGGR